ncbi:MAG: hypothetical protein LBL66_01200 [Clostridiales bacterium]|nr:hypothetical protein [Clostridiales bacterium]
MALQPVIARSERSERRSNLYIKRRVSCFVEIAASRFRAPRNDHRQQRYVYAPMAARNLTNHNI